MCNALTAILKSQGNMDDSQLQAASFFKKLETISEANCTYKI